MKTNTRASPEVRSYRPGDETALVDLWARAYADYGGSVPKTPEYWRWCVLERPGLEAEDIVILEENRTVTAYGVLGQKDTSVGLGGTVLELAVEPSVSSKERARYASLLISVLEARSRERGDQVFEASVPSNEAALVRALTAAGFKAEKSDSLQLVIVDAAGLMRKILERRISELPDTPVSFGLNFAKSEHRPLPLQRVRVELSPTSVHVEESKQRATCEVYTDLSSLLDIIFRRQDVDRVLRGGRIRAEPVDRTEALIAFLRLLVIRSNWYIPSV